MKRIFGTLSGRLSVAFLALLLALGAVQVWISMQTARQFARESDQSLNRHLASDLARTFQPALRDGLQPDAIGGLIHDMMVYNPRVEIYLLDRTGVILAYFATPEQIRRERVDLAPVRRFLTTAETLPILGDDPRDPTGRKPFSAAPIRIGSEPGYLYLILGGEKYESVAGMVEESFIIRNGVISLVGAVLVIALVGLLVFFLVTRRVRRMAGALRAFERGGEVPRLPERPPDELGQFAIAFNAMADRLAAHMEALQQADRLRRELVANVSHDLRSPLASLQGYLETVLIKEDLPAEDRQRFLRTIYDNALRLSTLVEELFELSRLEARQIQPRREPVALAELAQDVVAKCQPVAAERGVTLRGEFAPGLPFVSADIGMLERVFTNLLDNAIRFTPRDGTVTVRLSAAAGDAVRVAVADTGMGIAPADLPHVFERFYRADRSRSRHAGGSGIGLAIVRHILEAHGTTPQVESAPGRGSTFSFTLPALRGPIPPADPS